MGDLIYYAVETNIQRLTRLGHAASNVVEMDFLDDGGGFNNNHGDMVGFARYGKKPTSAIPVEQLTVETRYLNHAQRNMLGVSAESVVLGAEVACQVDVVSNLARVTGVANKGKYEKEIVDIYDHAGVRIELDKDGKVLALKGVTFVGRTPYTVGLPYKDTIDLANNIAPNIDYLISPRARPNKSKSSR